MPKKVRALKRFHDRYIPVFEYMFVFSKDKPKTELNFIMDRPNKHAGKLQGGGTLRNTKVEIEHLARQNLLYLNMENAQIYREYYNSTGRDKRQA